MVVFCAFIELAFCLIKTCRWLANYSFTLNATAMRGLSSSAMEGSTKCSKNPGNRMVEPAFGSKIKLRLQSANSLFIAATGRGSLR